MNEPVNKQKELIDFVNNPDNLKKAVEGSMQKRQDLIDRVSVNKQLEDLTHKVRTIIRHNVDIALSFNWNGDEHTAQVEDTVNRILALIASEKVKELERHIIWDGENVGGITMSSQEVSDRIKELKTIKENTNDSIIGNS